MKNLCKIDQRILLNEVKKMLHHFERYNFIQPSDNKSIKLGYSGENVKLNIWNEWQITSCISCDEPSFSYSSIDFDKNLSTAFNSVKSLAKELPFNIYSSKLTLPNVHDSSKNYIDSSDLITEYFKDRSGLTLQRYLFCSPEASQYHFHKLQRERTMWWKKFSASPGRFVASQVFNNHGGSLIVDIQAEFFWGNVTVERITLFPETLGEKMAFSGDGGKITIPSVISSETVLNRCTLTFLCDSYEAKYGELERKLLRLHRKLAPYKVSFAATPSEASDKRNMSELALLLTKQIRKNAVSVLLLPDLCSTPIKDQIIRNDSLGIPFTIMMTDETLSNGMLGIRSRDTTLQEQSHVSLLASQIEKMMKNY